MRHRVKSAVIHELDLFFLTLSDPNFYHSLNKYEIHKILNACQKELSLSPETSPFRITEGKIIFKNCSSEIL